MTRAEPARPNGDFGFKRHFIRTPPLDGPSDKRNFVSVFNPFWPLKTKRVFFKEHMIEHLRGSHLRKGATVKLDGAPNGWDAPRSSL